MAFTFHRWTVRIPEICWKCCTHCPIRSGKTNTLIYGSTVHCLWYKISFIQLVSSWNLKRIRHCTNQPDPKSGPLSLFIVQLLHYNPYTILITFAWYITNSNWTKHYVLFGFPMRRRTEHNSAWVKPRVMY